MDPKRRYGVGVALSLVTAAGLLWWQGPAYRRAFAPDFHPDGHWLFVPDFYQEWASARNFFERLPVYASHEVTLPRYLGLRRDTADPYFIERNAHPPPAVLLALPFARLSFADAFVVWNLISLTALAASAGLVVRHLGLAVPAWAWAPAAGFILFCHPFWHHMVHGQLNLLLLLLLTAAWAADRARNPLTAGALVGAAAAIKLFPAFMILYFLMGHRWRAAAASFCVLALISGLTILVLGTETYRDFALDVLPQTSRWRSDWHNLSLAGLWCKLFEPWRALPPVTVLPLAERPNLALAGVVLTGLSLTAVLSLMLPRLFARGDADLAYALTMLAMLLAGPITWDHTLLLLALPLALLWRRLSPGGWGREGLGLLVAVLWLEPYRVMEHVLILMDAEYDFGGRNWVATPWATATALTAPCYAILAVFALALVVARRTSIPDEAARAPVNPA